MAEREPHLKAVLFDIDGTLVDSNYLQVEAWLAAFEQAGHPVDAWRIHRSIGRDSGELLAGLLGGDADRLGKAVSTEHSRQYERRSDRLRAFDRARELLGALAERGHQVVLATSAPDHELATLRDLLDVEDVVSAVTSSEDVDTAKPDPGIVEVALRKAAVAADEAVFVGDSVWDVQAAGRAGVACIGVLSGGISATELQDAGAVAIYEDPGALLDHIETAFA